MLFTPEPSLSLHFRSFIIAIREEKKRSFIQSPQNKPSILDFVPPQNHSLGTARNITDASILASKGSFYSFRGGFLKCSATL